MAKPVESVPEELDEADVVEPEPKPHKEPDRGQVEEPEPKPHKEPDRGQAEDPEPKPHKEPDRGQVAEPEPKPHKEPDRGQAEEPEPKPHKEPDRGQVEEPEPKPHKEPDRGQAEESPPPAAKQPASHPTSAPSGSKAPAPDSGGPSKIRKEASQSWWGRFSSFFVASPPERKAEPHWESEPAPADQPEPPLPAPASPPPSDSGSRTDEAQPGQPAAHPPEDAAVVGGASKQPPAPEPMPAPNVTASDEKPKGWAPDDDERAIIARFAKRWQAKAKLSAKTKSSLPEAASESLPPLIPIEEGTLPEVAQPASTDKAPTADASAADASIKKPPVKTEKLELPRMAVAQDKAALPSASRKPVATPRATLPGLRGIDSIIGQLAAGEMPNAASLILARSYMELQAGQHPSMPPLEVAPPPVQKAPPVVAKLPIQEATKPTSKQSHALPSLEELFKGRPRSLQDEERQELWSRGFEFDLALVFPNPDYVDSPGLGTLWQRFYCHLFGAFKAADLTQARRGLYHGDARPVLHDCFCGINKDFAESTMEAAFFEAFFQMRPYEKKAKKARKSQAPAGPPVPETPRKSKKAEEARPRALAHGGSFRRVDVEEVARGSIVDDCEMGLASYEGAADVLYHHTMDPNLSGSTDLLSLIRNMLVAMLARSGLIVELVFSADFQWIYALVSASETAMEDLALRHNYPLSVDLAYVDPEAAEPCTHHYKLLADVYAKQGCVEVMELLCALQAQSQEAMAVQDGRAKPALSSREEVMKEPFLWYLRSRVKGRSTWVAKHEANDAWPEREPDSGPVLQNSWDRLLNCPGPEAVRVSDHLATSSTLSSATALHRFQAKRLNGQPAKSAFSRQDRTLLILAALGEFCDVFKLMRDGYLIDVLPSSEALTAKPNAEESLGQASSLHLGWRRHMSSWTAAPALFGIVAQVLSIFVPAEWFPEIWLGYAVLVSAWCSVAISAWRLKRSRLLLSRGEVVGPLEAEELWSWGIMRPVRPADVMEQDVSADARLRPLAKPAGLPQSAARPMMDSLRIPVTTKLLACARMTLVRFLFLVLALGCVGAVVAICDFVLLRHDHFKITFLRYNFAQDLIGLLTAAEIVVMNGILKRASLFLTRLEKHRSRIEFVRAHYLKAFCLQFINSCASLFYIAFYPDRWRLPMAVRYSCTYYADSWWNQWGSTCTMARLNKQLAGILLGLCVKAIVGQLALRVLSGRALKTAAEKTRRELPAAARRTGAKLIAKLDEIMATPRWGQPEADFNNAGFGCFGRCCEQAIVSGLLLLFAIVSPWSGLLAFIFLSFSLWADCRLPGRTSMPWRAGMPACPEIDFTAAGDWLLFTALRGSSWLAVPVFAALLIWPAQLGSGWLSATVLGRNGSWQGSDLAPFGLYTVILLLARWLPGLVVRCTPAASRLRVAEARLCRAMLKARHDLRGVATARSSRTLRGPLGSDFRVRTPHQWEQLTAKFSCS